MKLADRIAVVTGAAEGIGAAIAARLAREGCDVIVTDRDVQKGEAAAANIGARFFPLDVVCEDGWAALQAHLETQGKGLDILVNNAGVNPGASPIEDLDFEVWRRVLAVNLDGAFLGCRMALRTMRPRGGSIVNIGSAAGVRPVGELVHYSASKAGLHMLTRSVALYCGRKGLNIRANAVLPGSIETPMVDRLRNASGDPAAARARAASLHPIGFVGAPEDIASAVFYLVSDEARFVTGALVSVDGGLTL